MKDKDLPLVEYEGTDRTTRCELYKRLPDGSGLQRVECLFRQAWATHNRELFLNTQYSLSPAILSLDWGDSCPVIRHAEFTTRDVLPFTKIESRSQGGFGLVRRIEVHPDCHHFDGVLKSV